MTTWVATTHSSDRQVTAVKSDRSHRQRSAPQDLDVNSEQKKPRNRKPKRKEAPEEGHATSGGDSSADSHAKKKAWNADVVCHHCHQKGHIRPNCPLRRKYPAPTGDKDKATVAAVFVDDKQDERGYDARTYMSDDETLVMMIRAQPEGDDRPSQAKTTGQSRHMGRKARSRNARIASLFTGAKGDVGLRVNAKDSSLCGSTTALFDTGSAVTIIRADVALNMGLTISRAEPIKVSLAKGGEWGELRKQVVFYVGDKPRKVKAYVAQDLAVPLVVGRDQMKNFGVRLVADDLAELQGVGDGADIPQTMRAGSLTKRMLVQVRKQEESLALPVQDDVVDKPAPQAQRQRILSRLHASLQRQRGVSRHGKALLLSGKRGVRFTIRADAKRTRQWSKRPSDERCKQQQAVITKMLENDEIEVAPPADDPASLFEFNFFLVDKIKDGEIVGQRPIADARIVNSNLDMVESVPLQRSIGEFFRMLKDFAYISVIDLANAFHQILVDESCRKYLTFKVWLPGGLRRYRFKTLAQGLRVSSNIFSFIIEELMAGVLDRKHKSLVTNYIDDLVVITYLNKDEPPMQTADRHAAAVGQVLDKLTKHNLKVNPDKCRFGYVSATVLGWRVYRTGRAPLPSRAQAIRDIPVPRTVTEMRAFLGQVQFLAPAVPQLSDIVAPLTPLTSGRKNQKVILSDAQREAFNNAKHAVLQAVSLSFPVDGVPFELVTDASSVAVSALLLQRPPGQRMRVIEARSARLPAASRSWAPGRSELYAVCVGLEWMYAYTAGVDITVYTDHQSLVYLLRENGTKQESRAYQVDRYLAILARHRIADVRYVKSNDNPADYFTRIAAPAPMTRAGGDTAAETGVNEQTITNADTKTEECLVIQAQPDAVASDDLGGDRERQLEVLEKLHKERNHMGGNKLFLSAKAAGYNWPGMRTMCFLVTGRCAGCLERSVNRLGFVPLRSTSENVSAPWQSVSIDYGQLDGAHLFVAVDRFTKFIFLSCDDNQQASTAANTLMRMCALFGAPVHISTDNARTFRSHAFRSVVERLGINHSFIVPHQSRSNGAAERAVQRAKKGLVKLRSEYAAERVSEAFDKLKSEPEYPSFTPQDAAAMVMYRINTAPNEATGTEPYAAMFGRSGVVPRRKLPVEDLVDPEVAWVNWMKMRTVVYPALRRRSAEYAAKFRRRFDAHKRTPTMGLGQAVYVHRKTTTDRPAYSRGNEGPFYIIDVGQHHVVRLVDRGRSWSSRSSRRTCSSRRSCPRCLRRRCPSCARSSSLGATRRRWSVAL
eukprot:TRINITY_DN66247_c1_g1_i6.p1 TRINITY_DN66247_c1_g1~~TRINITY_DN66247_c1_g1_i6.p1  ORF type:complete len:1449 (+),score=413.70 TRINITY_DN66247_c1_g1_i6:507-4349(+)